MANKYKSLLKDTIIFAIGSLGSKIVLFFLVPLYTNFLSKSDYGISDLVFSSSQLLIPLASLVVGEAVIRFGLSRNAKKENVALSAFVVLMFAIIITIALTPIIGLYSVLSEWKWYLCVYVILSCFAEVERMYLKVKERNKSFSIINIISTLVLAIFNIFFIAFLRMGIKGYLLSNIIAQLVVVLVSFFASGLHKDLKKSFFDYKLTLDMVKYSSPLILGNVSWWVIHGSDKYMIEGFINSDALGLYTAATKIPSLINVFIGVFNQAWGISSIKEIEETEDTYFYYHVFELFYTLMFGVCIFLTSIIKPFMHIYVGTEFNDSWRFVPLLLVSAVYFSIQAFIGTLYTALKKTSCIMWTTLICAVVNVIVNFFCIPRIGVLGAVIGTLVSYFVITHIRLIDIKKHMKFVINNIKLTLNEVIIILQAVFITIDYYSVYVSVLSCVLFIIINFKSITDFIKSVRTVINKSDR